ncbi:MAG: mechanosensitive ion channel family protein, partial [Pseudomonadales bacterium]|nr:mechanosensitive ion channel family protein [Pseudomonadales bacterium]
NYLFDQAERKYQQVRQDLNALQESSADEKPSADEEPADGESAAEQADDEHGMHPYQNYRPIARRLMRFVLVVIAIFSLAIVWGHNLFALSSSGSMTAKFFSVTIDIIAAVLIADLIWIWAKTYIDKRLADYEPPEEGHAPGPEARMATLLPLLRSMLIVTLISMVVFSVLASLGFNIGPLLAGAGVIGLAIGFGAQTLVKDIVSGIFYLIDDAFRIGEYIEVGDLRGTVESMSVRSLRVRHHRGAVHTIPFGELSAITNHSRDWVIMKLEFRIPFDTNMKLVKKLIKKIGKELLTNEDFGHSFIQPLKSQGVRRMEEFNMVLGVKFMTRPGEQWVIRREAYHRIRDTFEANGISMAERNVKVQVLNIDTLDKSTKQAVVGAAHNAVEQQLPPGPIPDEP